MTDKSKPNLQSFTDEQVREYYEKRRAKLEWMLCNLCTKRFKQTRKWQKFCSDSCRVMFFRLRHAMEQEAKDERPDELTVEQHPGSVYPPHG